jgi:ATP synthase mitochondrial F1 complex assembly factor 2
VRPFTMPLMSLASTAIDQPKDRNEVIETMLLYLRTDSVVCRSAPGPVADRQALVLDPVLEWARKELGAEGLIPTDSIFGAQLPKKAVDAFRNHLQGERVFSPLSLLLVT